MSEQILLQGKILGIEEFLLSPPGGAMPARSNGEELLAGRSQWITLLCEVLPRALLPECGLPRHLLGSSGGGQFLLVLPGESRGPAEEFLAGAARQLGELSGGYLTLLWSVTENLGAEKRYLRISVAFEPAGILRRAGRAASRRLYGHAPGTRSKSGRSDTIWTRDTGRPTTSGPLADYRTQSRGPECRYRRGRRSADRPRHRRARRIGAGRRSCGSSGRPCHRNGRSRILRPPSQPRTRPGRRRLGPPCRTQPGARCRSRRVWRNSPRNRWSGTGRSPPAARCRPRGPRRP